MKTKLKYIALAIVILASSAARAESSVTLYGVIDVGIDFTNNSGGNKLWHMQDGTNDGLYGSRWGLMGSEDLGGGLKAIFKLENGFNLNDGTLAQGGREFGRQAYVGLTHDQWGTVTFGRQYDSVVDYYQPVTLIGTWGGVAWHASDIDNSANSFRVNNTIKYASPNFAGLTFGGMMGMTNSNAPGTATIGMYSAGAAYSIGNLNLAAAYLYAKDPEILLGGAFLPNTQGAAIGAAGPWSFVGAPHNEKIFGAGATYKLGNATLGLDYSNTLFNQANGTAASVKFVNYEAWASYAFTPSATVAAGYTFTDGSVGYSSARPKYHQIDLSADYKLSKRTEVYLSTAYQIAGAAGQPADIYDGVTGTASTTNHQFAARVGIAHRF